MSERSGKRPCPDSSATLNAAVELRTQVDALERKNEFHTVEYRLVENRLFHSAHLVEVNTESPIQISSSLAQMSRELVMMSHMCITENSKANKYGDKFILLLDNDGIPRNTWIIFSMLISNNIMCNSTQLTDTTIDDILYLIIKFNISMVDTDRSLYIGRVNCAPLIDFVCKHKVMQRFPRLDHMQKDIPQITALVEWYSNYLPMILDAKLASDTFNQLEYVPYLHSLIAIKLSKQFMARPPATSLPAASSPAGARIQPRRS